MRRDVRFVGAGGTARSSLEAQLEEGFFLVLTQRAEDLCRVKHVVPVHDPVRERGVKVSRVEEGFFHEGGERTC